MDLAQVSTAKRPAVLQGESLAPFLTPASGATLHHVSAGGGGGGGDGGGGGAFAATSSATGRRGYNVIQFHGCDIAMSWFSVVDGTYKYVAPYVAHYVTPYVTPSCHPYVTSHPPSHHRSILMPRFSPVMPTAYHSTHGGEQVLVA